MEISEIVKKQRAYFETGATRTAKFRIASLKKLQTALRLNEKAIAEAMKKDLNKQPSRLTCARRVSF
jgi:aldehyde dehydrogenase (NAD+)